MHTDTHTHDVSIDTYIHFTHIKSSGSHEGEGTGVYFNTRPLVSQAFLPKTMPSKRAKPSNITTP